MDQAALEDQEVLRTYGKCGTNPVVDGLDQLFAGGAVQADARLETESVGLPVPGARHAVSACRHRGFPVSKTTTASRRNSAQAVLFIPLKMSMNLFRTAVRLRGNDGENG